MGREGERASRLHVFPRDKATKMWLRGVSRTEFCVTVCLLCLAGTAAQKVHFECGAKLDIVDVQGLILSPGFPYNYSSGTHCVWQFFVPIGHQLIMEMFDFDVFESHNNPVRFASTSVAFEDEGPNIDTAFVSKSQADGQSKEPQSTLRDEVKQVVVQEQSTKMEMTKVANSAKMLSDSPLASQSVEEKTSNSAPPQALRSVGEPVDEAHQFISTSPPPATELDEAETQPPLMDACPHDVLYISDLMRFSSRFCGSRRPAGNQLVFGSEDEMVEVIMELITTTHWGRGFALLFHYENQTRGDGHQRLAPTLGNKAGALLGAASGTVVFAVALAAVFCLIFRRKLFAKRADVSSSSSETHAGVLNSAADGNELQTVSPDQLKQQQQCAKNDNNNQHLFHHSLTHTVKAACDLSELFSSDLTELELDTDEVFVIASEPTSAKLPVSPHTKRDRFSRHSDTGPSRSFDWPAPDPVQPTKSSSRPRAWSVRTFQDLLPPLPQLHKKWCSWNSSSPFTKLVDHGLQSTECHASGAAAVLSDVPLYSPDSFTSSALFPQNPRRLNSSSNLRRGRFAAESPASETPAAASGLQQEGAGEAASAEETHVTVPVFAISEEEDQQPLVASEPLRQLTGGGAS